MSSNPLLKVWEGPFALPPFKEILPSCFPEAFTVAEEAYMKDIKDIVQQEESNATFENTIKRLDGAGALYKRISKVYSNLCSSMNVPELQTIQLDLAPKIASFNQKIYTYSGLFKRIDEVHQNRNSPLLHYTGEQLRLIDRFHLDFIRAGAQLSSEDQVRYSEIVEKQAELQTKFSQNVMSDETNVYIELHESDLAGCPDFLIRSARQAAEERNLKEGYCVTLSRSLVVPFLTFSERRDLREIAWRKWTNRGLLTPETDNTAIIVELLKLRCEQAKFFGHSCYADFALEDTMAMKPENVMKLLNRVWVPAQLAAANEKKSLEDLVLKTTGEALKIEPWDWRYFAEKSRKEKFDLDEAELKPYFPLERMVDAIFDCAYQLFGLRYILREDIEAYHPDVKVYEVRETTNEGEDKLVGVFLHDNFMRTNKQSGAWMSEYRNQEPGVVPIISNNNNFSKSSGDEPTLLSFDDAKTLFHEFGHQLHGLLSNVNYSELSGTSVLRDFVELPSQLFEHWLDQEVVLKKHARHYQTGEAIPESLLAKLKAARNFNNGFDTIEYTASALIDQALHKLNDLELTNLDVLEFEKKELEALRMPEGIPLRHRPIHFQHLFSSSSYSSQYYVYLWAEVLDADAFNAFTEKGDCFDPETARKVRDYIYSSGNSIEPGEAFRLFRGRDPLVEPMLKKKGLL